MKKLTSLALAAALAVGGLTAGGAQASAAEPVKKPVVQEQVGERAMTEFQAYFDPSSAGNTKIAVHSLYFKGDTNTSHNGRSASYQIKSPSGKVIASGTSPVYSFNINDWQIGHTTNALEFNFSGYLNGTYTVTYSYVAGGETHTSNSSIKYDGWVKK